MKKSLQIGDKIVLTSSMEEYRKKLANNQIIDFIYEVVKISSCEKYVDIKNIKVNRSVMHQVSAHIFTVVEPFITKSYKEWM